MTGISQPGGISRAEASSTYGSLASFAPSAVTQLTIPTYDGSGQATHPSVIDLGGAPISGYRYWMAFTPYPGADSTKENPSIVASNDMITWAVPAGVTNPLVAYPGSPFFNSDTHLIFWGAKFWLYYRTSGAGMNDKFSVITSTDGITWAAPIVVAQTATSWNWVSPSFRVVDGRVVCWFVQSKGGPTVYPNDIFTMESLDGLTFRNTRKCSLTLPAGATPWHIDVDYGLTATGDPIYLLAATAYISSSDANHGSLYLAQSGDGVSFQGRGALVAPTGGTFYDQGIYRPSILRSGSLFRVFFGAYMAAGSASHIGYIDITPTWGSVQQKVSALRVDTSERVVAQAWVGSAYTAGTNKVKGTAPTLILPKATSSIATMWSAFHVPYGVEGGAVVDIYWLVEDALTGNIKFRVYDIAVLIGVDNLGGTHSANGAYPAAAPGIANILQRTSVPISHADLLDGGLSHIRVSRDGQGVEDTYASDVLLFGFTVRYGDPLTITP